MANQCQWLNAMQEAKNSQADILISWSLSCGWPDILLFMDFHGELWTQRSTRCSGPALEVNFSWNTLQPTAKPNYHCYLAKSSKLLINRLENICLTLQELHLPVITGHLEIKIHTLGSPCTSSQRNGNFSGNNIIYYIFCVLLNYFWYISRKASIFKHKYNIEQDFYCVISFWWQSLRVMLRLNIVLS